MAGDLQPNTSVLAALWRVSCFAAVFKNEKHIPATGDNPWHNQSPKSDGFLFSRCCKGSLVTQRCIRNSWIPVFPQTISNGAGKHHVMQLVNLVKHLTNSLWLKLFLAGQIPQAFCRQCIHRFHSLPTLHWKYKIQTVTQTSSLATHDKDKCHLTFAVSLMLAESVIQKSKRIFFSRDFPFFSPKRTF